MCLERSSVSFDFIWFHSTWNFYEFRMATIAWDGWKCCWDFAEREGKSKKSKKSIFSKLLLWEKLGDIRNTMPSRKPGQLTWQWVSMSAISAVRILPQMSEHDILRKIWINIVKKCILVCIWFSKCGTLILWSECALLFPLKLKPSFSNRKVGVPTYPGKLVPGY